MRIKPFTFTNKCLYTTNNIFTVWYEEEENDLSIPMHVANKVIYWEKQTIYVIYPL